MNEEICLHPELKHNFKVGDVYITIIAQILMFQKITLFDMIFEFQRYKLFKQMYEMYSFIYFFIVSGEVKCLGYDAKIM